MPETSEWRIECIQKRPCIASALNVLIFACRTYVARPVPVVAVFGIIYYVYHAYVFLFAFNYIDAHGSDSLIKTCLVVFHLFIVLVLASYLRAVFTTPDEVVFHLPDDVHTDPRTGEKRRSSDTYCSLCRGNRPPRTHHCRLCGRCLGTSFVASSIYAISHLVGPVSVGVKGLMALTTVLAIVMVPFSSYHFYLVFSNQTTLEHAISIAECEPNRFSRGCCHNTASLCGDSRLWWLFPVEPVFSSSTVYKTEQFSV